ncbi:MAG: hypothetical protein ACKOXP_03475 [Flavobacteriales bacterium]
MKDGLENSFKEALNNFELPYDANAWDALNQKLSPKRWYQSTSVKWSAAFVVAIGLVAYFSLPSSSNQGSKETQEQTTSKETNSTPAVTPTPRKTATSTIPSIVHPETKSTETATLSNQGFTSPLVVTELMPHSIPPVFNQMDILGLTDQTMDGQEPTPVYDGRAVMIDFKNRCQGETLQLEADKHHERIIHYAGKELHFSYNENISFKLTQAGNVSLTANTGPYGQFEEFGSFEVNAAPTIAISTDHTITYEDGLPKINCQVEAKDAQILWHSNVNLTNNSGKTTDILAFEKGYAIVEVQVLAANGCKSKEKEMIQIPSDYNLLAVNAFNPQSSDSRNSSFMPFALTIRQTPFKLVVLDPDNGGLIFESTDANNAWDGTDRRDGKLVPGNKAFIWKVVLQNPIAGEKGEYRGTIVRM